MHDEDGFLAAIRHAPADDTARLVFADWLDEQGDVISKTKATFIRLELQMAAAPEKSPNRIRWTTALRKLAADLDPMWLAVISHPKLEACRLSFRFACPKEWTQLTPTTATNVRRCATCQQHVHFLETIASALTHAARGHCVALTPALVRKPDDFLPSYAPPDEPVLLTGVISRPRGRLPLRLPRVDVPEPDFLLPAPSPAPQWVPEPSSERVGRSRRRRERRPRNLQRENWEEPE